MFSQKKFFVFWIFFVTVKARENRRKKNYIIMLPVFTMSK